VFVTDADNREVLEYGGTSGQQILRWYAYGAGPNAVLNRMDLGPGTRQTLIPDIQGSIAATQDSSTGALTPRGYLPYGESSPAPGTFAYTGQRNDDETGLYYYRARMYAPNTGVFLQADPTGPAGGKNPYAYVGGDPLNRVDPGGQEAQIIGDVTQGLREGVSARETLQRISASEEPSPPPAPPPIDTPTLPAPAPGPGAAVGLLDAAAAAAATARTAAGMGLGAAATSIAGAAGVLLYPSSTQGPGADIPPQYVVRAGAGEPASFRAGTEFTINGYGFSVQTAPGLGHQELARAAPNIEQYGKYSYTTVQQLQAIPGVAVNFPTEGRGTYHGTVNVPYPAPPGLFEAIAGVFQQVSPNPFRVR
jgi:RHS repeat-associated protein